MYINSTFYSLCLARLILIQPNQLIGMFCNSFDVQLIWLSSQLIGGMIYFHNCIQALDTQLRTRYCTPYLHELHRKKCLNKKKYKMQEWTKFDVLLFCVNSAQEQNTMYSSQVCTVIREMYQQRFDAT